MIGYFKNRDRVTLLNQSFWHTRQRSFRREICQLIHRPRLGCRPRGLHFSWTQGTGTRGGIIPGRALATTLLGGSSLALNLEAVQRAGREHIYRTYSSEAIILRHLSILYYINCMMF
jgi:hypothetical protein